MEIKKIGFVFILLMIVCMVVPVMAATPTPEPKMGEDGWDNPNGALYVSLMCNHNLISKDVLIYRIDANNTIPFVNGALVLKDTYDMVPKMTEYPKTILLNNGGGFDVFLSPGPYALKLNDGNGGQPEYALVNVYHGGRSNVAFIGHAVSFDHGKNPQCVPDKTFTIISAKYGSMEKSCKEVPDVLAHTEYAYWITGTPSHTEYSFRDWIPSGMMEVCYPEVNHTVFHPEVNHTVFHPEVNHTVCYSETNHTVFHPEVNHTVVVVDDPAHYVIVPVPSHDGYCKVVDSNYDFVIGTDHYRIYKGNGDPKENGYTTMYNKVGSNPDVYAIVSDPVSNGNCKIVTGNSYDFMIGDTKYKIGSGNGYNLMYRYVPETTHNNIVVDTPAWTETVVDTPAHCDVVVDTPTWTETVVDDPAHNVIVVDTPAYCEQVLDPNSLGHWGEWSAFSDTQVTPIPEVREVQTRLVSDDMTNGHYSDWSDTPEGSCIQKLASIESTQVNTPCITREVPTTYKEVCENVGLYTDVRAEVQKIVDSGVKSFVFNNGQNPGGVFSITGSLLAEVADPAPGLVKTVEIVYNDGCSGDKTVIGNEYEVITLGTLIPVPK